MQRRRDHAMRAAATFFVLACGAVFVVSVAIAAPPAAGYHLVKKIILGGEGGWDYVTADSSTHRVFIPRGTHTMVLDPDGKVVGDIPNMQGAHGVDVAPELKRGFTSNGGNARSVTIFDLGTLQPIREVKVGEGNPDYIFYDPGSKRVFSINRQNDVTAIDAQTGEVVGRVALPGRLESGLGDGTGRVYVNIMDKNQIAAIDSKTLKVLDTWSIAPCKEPRGMAIDVAHKRLFAGCLSGSMAMVDYTSGRVVDTVPIGEGTDATRFDPGTGLAFASCIDGTITVAHEDSPDKLTVVQTIKTQAGARTMALDTKNHNIYTVTAEFGPIPAATPERPEPRAPALPNSFTLLIFSR